MITRRSMLLMSLHYYGYTMVVSVKESILVVATPFPTSGGGLRASRSINEYSKYFDTHLLLPYGARRRQPRLQEFLFNSISRSRVTIAGFSILPRVIEHLDDALIGRVPRTLMDSVFTTTTRLKLSVQNRYRCIVSLHECIDAVYAGYISSKLFDAPAICLLQLPPFYGSRERLRNIMKSLILWRKCTLVSDLVKLLSTIETAAEYSVVDKAMEKVYRYILQRYDMVMAVSRSIPYEMGSEWIDRMFVLDPGVSLDEEDLNVMKRTKAKVREKENYIVFGGRPVAAKGITEALIVSKFVSKKFNDIKLVFTGTLKDSIVRRIMYVSKKLGIEDKVLLTGFLPRNKRLEVVAKAKLMLYPSHVDAFSYAVLESLHLGTPVTAYSIPALEFYYSRSPGAKLVEEWDLEALTIETIDILERGIEAVEPPELPNWSEIMNREVAVIRRIIEKTGRKK